MKPSLEVEIWCDGKSETYTFADFPVRIGRDTSCELFLTHGFVSRKHARIERGAREGFLLFDEGGQNGVSLGGAKLRAGQAVELVDGAEFAIETLVARVRYAKPDDKATSLYADRQVVPELLARAAVAMEAYRVARAEVLAVVSNSLAAIPDQERESMASELVSLHEELASDPYFRTIVDSTRLRQRPAPSSVADDALHGLQRLATAYAPAAPTLCTAESIHAFLRAVDCTLRTFLVSKAHIDSASRGDHTDGLEHARGLGHSLLDWRNDPVTVTSTVERDFLDLASRYRDLLAQADSRRVLDALSPAAIESAAKASSWPFAARARWQEFSRRHAFMAATLGQQTQQRIATGGGRLSSVTAPLPPPAKATSDATEPPPTFPAVTLRLAVEGRAFPGSFHAVV